MKCDTFLRRFWGRVDKSQGCWIWTGMRSEKGYGRLISDGKRVRAHRVAWELDNGIPVPPGLDVLHRCDTPPCCNPAHLFLGTQAENLADRDRKGRAVYRRGTNNGSARLSEGDVRQIRNLAKNGVQQKDIAARFDIAQATVSLIVGRKTWRHIA